MAQGLVNSAAHTMVTFDIPTNVMSQTSTLTFPMKHVRQLFLVAHQAANTSVPLFQVELGGGGSVRWRDSVSNLTGMTSIYLPGATGGAVTWFPQPVPVPRLTENQPLTNRDVTMTLKVADKTGASFTHGGITFWFAAIDEKAPDHQPLSDKLALMGTRTF